MRNKQLQLNSQRNGKSTGSLSKTVKWWDLTDQTTHLLINHTANVNKQGSNTSIWLSDFVHFSKLLPIKATFAYTLKH